MSTHTLHEQIAWASRILAMDGHGDFTLGHVSGREGDRIHMKRNYIGLEEVCPRDVLTIDLEGRKIAGEGSVHLEAVLHTAVYRNRADVKAVIHTHPPYTTAFGATNAELAMINHDAVLFHQGLAYYDETAELIMTPEQGEGVAQALGSRSVVIMRGHGVLIAERSLPWAVYTALTLERVLRLQAIAQNLGELRPMSREMAASVYPDKYRDEFVDIYWRYMIRQVQRFSLDDGMDGPDDSEHFHA
ncbi:MAG: class II aldolase/adducin family protein [Thermomicrobiales bacterium]